MNPGGYFRGPWWRYVGSDKETTRRCFVAAWGNIVKMPREKMGKVPHPEFDEEKRSDITYFVIKTGRGANRNEKHLSCYTCGDNDANRIARSSSKADIVLCLGTWTEEQKVNRKKQLVPVYQAKINFIINFGHIGFLHRLYEKHRRLEMGMDRFIYGLYLDPNIRAIAEKNAAKDDEADPWETDEEDEIGF